jgi:hypothetical protein
VPLLWGSKNIDRETSQTTRGYYLAKCAALSYFRNYADISQECRKVLSFDVPAPDQFHSESFDGTPVRPQRLFDRN